MKRPGNKTFLFVLAGIFVTAITFNGCKDDDPELPNNPYDNVDYGGTTDPNAPDPNSFEGIHTNILVTRCAVPGCHDGHFEPDFRSIQSSYSTLVYHPIIKNSPDEAFTYRVVPFEPSQSVLYERITNCCFVNVNDRMPQDNIGEPLSDELIGNVRTWIENGALDMFGQGATLPNSEPDVIGYIAADPTFTIDYSNDIGNRCDSVFFNPFKLPDSSNVTVVVFVEDDNTAVADLMVNELRISSDPNDFSNAQVFPGVYSQFNNDEFYLITLNTEDFPTGQINYMRYFVQDADQTSPSQFPTDNLPEAYKTYYSFIVEP